MAAQLAPHGSEGAYRRHLRHGEKPCTKCAAAARQRRQDRKVKVRSEKAALVQLRISPRPEPAQDEPLDELTDARANMRLLQAAMREAAPGAMASLSKQREALAARIARLQEASKPKTGVLDEIARRRAARLANTAT